MESGKLEKSEAGGVRREAYCAGAGLVSTMPEEHIYVWRKRDKGEGIPTGLLPGINLLAETVLAPYHQR